jgi:hypothetical protein
MEQYDYKKLSPTDDPRIATTQIGTIVNKFVGGLQTLKRRLLPSNVVQSRQSYSADTPA